MKRLQKNIIFRVIVWVVTYLMIMEGAILPMQGLANLYAEETKSDLVSKGIDEFKAGENESASKTFQAAKDADPNNSIVAYYLGLTYLKLDNLPSAISEWRRYLTLDSKSETAVQIRRDLTIIVKEDARRYAEKAVKDEEGMQGVKADTNTLAVTYFANNGKKEYDPLSKGLVSMLITDLSAIHNIKVVERARVQALYDEKKLGASGMVEKSTIPSVGKLLLAGSVATGNYMDMADSDLHVASVVMETASKTEKGSTDTTGKILEFYDLEKKIAASIAGAMGTDWANAPEAAKKIHTKNFEAFENYSKGIDYMDKDDYDNARKSLQKSVDIDPNFDLAQTALKAVPLVAATIGTIISSASAVAPSAAVGTTAGAAAGAVSAGASTAGTIAAIGGTVAAVGGTVLSTGVISGGCDAYKNTSWSGTYNYNSCVGGISGGWSGSIDSSCNFTISIAGASAPGKVSGNSVTGVGASPRCGQVTISGSINGTTIGGSISDTGGGSGTWSGNKQ